MSTKLKPLDLTGAVVGTTGIIDFNNFVKFQANNFQEKAHLWIFNESGAGIDCLFQNSNNYHFLPAGAWGTFEIEPNDSQVQVTVAYVIPNPPVSLVQAAYYMPGEKVPQAFTLGNSPIGGGTTTTGNSLSNETNPANTEVIDIGVPGNTKLMDVFTDHFIWSVLQSGVAHQVLKGQTAGSPLQIGQAGDITDVLGALGIAAKVTTLNGGTAGTATLYEILTGTPKLSLVFLNGFRTAAAIQNLTWSVPYTTWCKIWIDDTPNNTQFLLAGVAKQMILITGLASGGGTTSTGTGISAYSQGAIQSGFDSMSFPANNNTNRTGLHVFFGV